MAACRSRRRRLLLPFGWGKNKPPSVRARLRQQTGAYVEETAHSGRRAAKPTRSTSRIHFVTYLCFCYVPALLG
jgi:hypothetical protein